MYELRKDLRVLMERMRVTPSKMARADVEQMINVYSKAVEVKAAEPPVKHRTGGRTKARDVDTEENDGGIAVPKKLHKEKTEYAIAKEKKAKKPTAAAKVEEDSGTGSESEEDVKQSKKAVEKIAKAAVAPTEKPKRVLSAEQLAKMKAGREAKKAAAAAASGEPAAEKKAEPKKEVPPPDAPPAESMKKEKKLPVFKNLA